MPITRFMQLQIDREVVRKIARYGEVYEKKFLDVDVDILHKD